MAGRSQPASPEAPASVGAEAVTLWGSCLLLVKCVQGVGQPSSSFLHLN